MLALAVMASQRSPIVLLQDLIAGVPFRISPEREGELKEFLDRENISLAIEDGPGFRFEVNLNDGTVTTNVASLEFLWASTHAHLILYDEYSKAQRSGDSHFDASSSTRARAGIDLVNWTIRNMADTGTASWPHDLPKPELDPPKGSDVHVANELFLCSIAWIIHHELSHVRLGHNPLLTIRSQTEEKEADLGATEWILNECADNQEYRKRTIGIAAAILSLQGIAGDTSFDIRESHPRAFERIDYCLTSAGIDDNEEVFAFAACIMQIQLSYYGINIAHDGSSFRDLYSKYLIEFARK